MAVFSGVKRRFQFTGEWNGVGIYDDYGHHPAEIAAVLAAARGGAKGKVIAVVEPHRYTRVRDLFDDFARCFKDADHVIVAPLYTAGERPLPGIDHRTLAERIGTLGRRSVEAVDDPMDLLPPSSGRRLPATSSFVSARATRPNGRTRFPNGWPRRRSAPGASGDVRRRHG